MHELSIAQNIVEIASASAQEAGAKSVFSVHLRMGPLSGVVMDALQFCFEMVTQDTPLAGSQLVVEEVPITLFCSHCNKIVTPVSLQCFHCSLCDEPSNDIRSGKELEITSMEIDT